MPSRFKHLQYQTTLASNPNRSLPWETVIALVQDDADPHDLEPAEADKRNRLDLAFEELYQADIWR